MRCQPLRRALCLIQLNHAVESLLWQLVLACRQFNIVRCCLMNRQCVCRCKFQCDCLIELSCPCVVS
ncbi:DUF3709 domain-containing protein (plasmid) [Vibrio sp. HDW18]|nr:DUF3709 domain-containing protein [Vibrio sp. HDW18]